MGPRYGRAFDFDREEYIRYEVGERNGNLMEVTDEDGNPDYKCQFELEMED